MGDNTRDANGRWRFTPTFRQQEVKQLAAWIDAGVSGSVVGLHGSGKSNLFQFMLQQPQHVQQYLHCQPVILVGVDLNLMTSLEVSTLYRLLLRALFEAREQFPPPLKQALATAYTTYYTQTDPMIAQQALRDLLYVCAQDELRVVLLLDQFDTFCREATGSMKRSLRALRDSYKRTLSYIVGVNRAIYYLDDEDDWGNLLSILDMHTLWLGPMNDADSRLMIAQEMARFGETALEDTAVSHILQLTGGYPALLKVVTLWWRHQGELVPPDAVTQQLLKLPRVTQRLRAIWQGLDQEEQLVLHKLVQPASRPAADMHLVLAQLVRKGVIALNVEGGYEIHSGLLVAYIQTAVSPGRGRIWQEQADTPIYQGVQPMLDLTPLEHSVLAFLLQHPRQRLTKTEIIDNAWEAEHSLAGVTDDSMYQVISGIRKKVEPNPAQPRYLVNWRGRPEGGYQLFPEGQPM